MLAQLDHLSSWEVQVIADALEGGSPTFYHYVFSPPVTMLQANDRARAIIAAADATVAI